MNLKLTPVSEFEAKSFPRQHEIKEAIRKILPEEYQILPDGRSTTSVIMKIIGEISTQKEQ